MYKFQLIAFLFLVLGCKKPEAAIETPKGLVKNNKITVENMVRNYHQFLPNQMENAPIVILLHGNGGSADDLLGETGVKAPYKTWLDLAAKENILLLIPDGREGSSGKKGWNDCRNDAAENPTTNDVLFISNLIDAVQTAFRTNAKKVYIVGTSNGGHLAIRLAQELPQKITAFASIVAAMSDNSKCSNSTIPISALFMNGTDDQILPYNGGQMASMRGKVQSTDKTISYWVTRNGTATVAETFNFPDINTADGCKAEKYLYKNGTNRTEVALYKIVNGGHTEPSLSERYNSFFLSLVGKQNGDFDMAIEIWTFFKDKTK